jgi:caffeoyl-CoA O-methyltransferase
MKQLTTAVTTLLILIGMLISTAVNAQYPPADNDLDKKVVQFLKEQAGQWRDMNVPVADGRILYDLVLKGKYKQAVEIGTSTGHSAIWIAWALSKTGGKLITIEIDKKRYIEAMANFKKSGLLEYIDARLGDAHELVPALSGSYDFVFCDADKWWYKNYFIAMENKIVKGGCFIAHNTNMRSSDIREYLDYVQTHPKFTTTIEKNSRSGISITCKK